MHSKENLQNVDLAELAEMLPQQLNITDIIIDCMYHIFDYLELEDLLNVADSCKALCHIASQIFESKYAGNKIVGIGNTMEVWELCNVGGIYSALADEEMNR